MNNQINSSNEDKNSEDRIMQIAFGVGGDERPFLGILTSRGRIFTGAIHGQGVWDETDLTSLLSILKEPRK